MNARKNFAFQAYRLLAVLALQETGSQGDGSSFFGCLSAKKFPTFASGRTGVETSKAGSGSSDRFA
jgi:hypothetical protein